MVVFLLPSPYTLSTYKYCLFLIQITYCPSFIIFSCLTEPSFRNFFWALKNTTEHLQLFSLKFSGELIQIAQGFGKPGSMSAVFWRLNEM